MKETKHVTDLMLDLYHLNAASKKEIKIIEEALSSDAQVKMRYEEIKRFDAQTRSKYDLNKVPSFCVIKNDKQTKDLSVNKKVFLGVGIAAILVCILTFAFIYFSRNISDNTSSNNQITEEEKLIPEDNTFITENKSNEAEQEKILNVSSDKTETAKKNNLIDEKESVSIAALPEPQQQEIHTRGGALEQVKNTVPEQKNTQDKESLNIPPGITFIFEAMFANKQLTEITIPLRITSIGKNAFADNPIVSITIGDNISIDDSAIPGNFSAAYNNHGKAAGTYTRTDINSIVWSKK